MQILEFALEVCLIDTPRQPVHTGCGIRLEFQERHFQLVNADVVEERGELLLLPFFCCFPYALQRLGHVCPALRPVRALLVRLPLGLRPWLCRLRRGSLRFVRRLLSYYGEVRLLPRVHHRLRLLASPMRTDLPAQTVTRALPRFPYKELRHMPGSLTTRDWSGPRDIASVHIAFRAQYGVGIPGKTTFAAQWLAYALPRQRFA